MKKRVKKGMMKSLSLVLCLLMLFSCGIAEAFKSSTNASDRGYFSLDVIHNRLLMAGADPVNGRFIIRTLEGDPNNHFDRRIDLLAPSRLPGAEAQWGAETSFTTMRINGENYIFGNNYSFLGLGSSVLSNEMIDQGTHVTVWQAQGLQTTQTLSIPQDETDPKAGLVGIGYALHNTTSAEMEVGVRVLLDLAAHTNWEQSDTPLVIIPGPAGEERIRFETAYAGADLPQTWQTLSTRQIPGILDGTKYRHTAGILRGVGDRDPDRLVVGHWKNLSAQLWNYTPDSQLNFMSADNPHQTGDSAVAIYWETVMLKPGETLRYKTYYGVGAGLVSKNPLQHDQVDYPGVVRLTEQGDAYADFELRLPFRNNYNKTLESVTVLLNPKGFNIRETRLLTPEGMEQRDKRNILGLGELKPGEVRTIIFTMEMRELLRQTEVRDFIVDVAYKDSETGKVETESYSYNIIVPALANWPTVTFTGITPDNPYFRTRTFFNIQGSGFNYLGIGSSGNLQIVFEDINDPTIRAEVRPEFVRVISDNIIRFSFHIGEKLSSQREYSTAIDTKYRITISHKDRVIDSHTFESIITASSLERHKNRDYGILVIYREFDNYEYKSRVFINEHQLEIFQGERNAEAKLKHYPLVTIRGSIFGDAETGFQVADGAVINDFVHYQAPQDHPEEKLFVHKYPPDGGHPFPYLRLDGRGILMVGGEEIIDDSFYLKLEDQSAYSLNWAKGDECLWGDPTDFGDEFPGEVSLPLPVMIHRDNSDVVNLLKKILGFLVSVEDIRLRANGISLGGHLGFFLDAGLIPGIPFLGDSGSGSGQSQNEAAKAQISKKGQLGGGVYIDDIRYGPRGYEGIKGKVTVAIPSQFIPVFNFGATGSLLIDSIEDIYGVDLDFKFQFLETEGKLTMKLWELEGGMLPIPDTVDFTIRSWPGLPIFPPTILFHITEAGGGIGNISAGLDLLIGKEISVSPWGRISGGISTPGAFLSGSPVEIYISVPYSEIRGHLNLMSLKVADAKLQVLIGPQYGIRLVGEGGLNMLDAITGRAQLFIGYNNDPRNPLSPLELGGRAKVTGQIPVLGIRLADAMAGISSQDIYVRGKLIHGLVDVGAKYHWGDNRFYFASLDPALPGAAGSGNEYVCVVTPTEKLVIDNFTLLDSSRKGTAGPLQLADLGKVWGHTSFGGMSPIMDRAMLDYAAQPASAAREHEITLSRSAQTLLRVIYSGSRPQLELRRPDGSLFELVEDENYQPGEGGAGAEHSIWILLDETQKGIWQLSSDKTVDYELIEVSPLAALTGLNAYPGENGTVNVLLQTELGKGLGVRLYLSEDTEEAGQFLGEFALEDDHAQLTLELPAGISAGDYYIRAELMEHGSNIHNIYAAETFEVWNPYTPLAPGQVDLKNAGNNLLQVNWDALDDTAVGYYLELLDEDGRPIPDVSAAYHARQEGMVQEALFSGRWQEHGAAAGEHTAGNLTGLRDGQLCQVAVTAVNMVKEEIGEGAEAGAMSEVTYTSKPTVSNTVNFREARYPRLSYTLENTGGLLLEQTPGEGKEYLSNAKEITLNLSVDTPARLVVLQEGELAAAGEGTALEAKLTLQEGSNELSVYAQNDGGDRIMQRIPVRVDTTPPVLMIGSPEQGSIIPGEQVEVIGFAEPGSRIIVNGAEIETAAGGNFTALVPLGQKQSKLIIVEAVDAAGNTSTYETRVLRETPAQIKSVRIGVEAEKIEQYEPVTLQLYATYEDGSELIVDNRNLVWSLPGGGEGFASITEAGELVIHEEGSVYVMASYPLTENFALQDIRLLSLGEVDKFASPPEGKPAEPKEPAEPWEPLDPFYPADPTDPTEPTEPDETVIPTPGPSRPSQPSGPVEPPVTEKPAMPEEPLDDKAVTKEEVLNVIINNKPYELTGKVRYDLVGGQARTTILMAETVFSEMLDSLAAPEQGTEKHIITIIFSQTPAITAVQLTGRQLQDMVAKGVALQLKSHLGTYTVPTEQININQAVSRLGEDIGLKDIDIIIVIETPTEETIKVIASNLAVQGYEVQATPLHFKLTCAYNGKTVNVVCTDYAEKAIALPAGVDPGIITTAVVVEPAGTIMPVPTGVREIAGRYYAVINSLRNNETYALIYNREEFPDMSSHWARAEVNDLGSRLIIRGTGDGLFEPDRPITRAEFATVLVRALGLKTETGDLPFSDLTVAWSRSYIGTAWAYKLISGYGDGTFGPDNPTTREQAMAIITRSLELTGQNIELTTQQADSILRSYRDHDTIAGWARQNVATCIMSGIITGRLDGTLSPQDNISRAETAVIIRRLLQLSQLIK